MRDSKSVLRYN